MALLGTLHVSEEFPMTRWIYGALEDEGSKEVLSNSRRRVSISVSVAAVCQATEDHGRRRPIAGLRGSRKGDLMRSSPAVPYMTLLLASDMNRRFEPLGNHASGTATRYLGVGADWSLHRRLDVVNRTRRSTALTLISPKMQSNREEARRWLTVDHGWTEWEGKMSVNPIQIASRLFKSTNKPARLTNPNS